MDALYVFINEVERQLNRNVKIVKFDRGGEYYQRYTDKGQCLGPFAKFLERCGICTQYTMQTAPEQNDVAKRHIRRV